VKPLENLPLMPDTRCEMFSEFFEAIALILGVVVVMAILSWATILPSILFLLFIFYIRRFYLRTASSLKRLEAIRTLHTLLQGAFLETLSNKSF